MSNAPPSLAVCWFETADGLPALGHRAFLDKEEAVAWLRSEGYRRVADDIYMRPMDLEDPWGALCASLLDVDVRR